jgi:hypothetical protein
MKYFSKGLFVVLTVMMSLIVVQSACAQTVSGTITEISTQPNVIVVEGTQISGIRFNYLCNQYGICLEEGDEVSVEYFEYVCSDGSILFKACAITVNDATISLRTCE